MSLTYAEEIKRKIYSDKNEVPVPALAYARVSTDNDGQKESCEHQIEMIRNFARDHPNIDIVDECIDDGISGKNDENRPQYQKAMDAISSHRVRLIVIKSQSRLNRSSRNSDELLETLYENDATILIVDTGEVMDFEDFNSRLIYNIRSVMDEQYVWQQRQYGLAVQKLRCVNKELSAKDVSFGYDWDQNTKEIRINEDQKIIVIFIYEEYVYYNRTPAEIEKELAKKGVKLSSKTINRILQDTRFVGKFYINKRTSKLGIGKSKTRRIKLPKDQWVLVERPDLAFLDKDLFEMAQKIRAERTKFCCKSLEHHPQAYFRGTHLFAGKIVCVCCGKAYIHGYADRAKTLSIYRIHNHGECENTVNRVYEEDIERIVKECLKKIIRDNEQICKTLEQTLERSIRIAQGKNGPDIGELKKQKEKDEKKLDTLIDELSEGYEGVAKERIQNKINSISTEIEDLEKELTNLETKQYDDGYVAKKIESVRKSIDNLTQFTSIDREQVLNYIDKIMVHPNGDIDVLLRSGKEIWIKKK